MIGYLVTRLQDRLRWKAVLAPRYTILCLMAHIALDLAYILAVAPVILLVAGYTKVLFATI